MLQVWETLFMLLVLSKKKKNLLFLIFHGLTHIVVLLLFCLFSYKYLTAVIFIGGNNIDVISSIANVLPLILLFLRGS